MDVGTGAGPIIIALCSELKNGKFIGSEVSADALKVAKKNAEKNGVVGKVEFIKSDLFENIKGKFDIITANLPYIPHEDLPGLSVEIHHYEPRIALDGGNGGLVIYEKFLKSLPKYLNKNGFGVFEIGKGQGENFKKLVSRYLPEAECVIKKDLAGFDRLAILRFD